MNLRILTTAFVLVLGAVCIASAHDGKRIEIEVQDDRIYGQGYLFASDGNPVDDSGGITRPYQNAIHSHFTSIGSVVTPDGPIPIFSNISGFDLRNAEPFEGANLILTLTGAGKWDNAPAPDGSGVAQDFGVPQLSPLGPDENIEIFFESQPEISTDAPGSFTLVDSVSGPVTDIDLSSLITFDPAGTIHYLEWTLSTSKPGILDSQPIYTILSPPGSNHIDRMHFQSLALERHFGIQVTPIPEPGSFACIALSGLILAAGRNRR